MGVNLSKKGLCVNQKEEGHHLNGLLPKSVFCKRKFR